MAYGLWLKGKKEKKRRMNKPDKLSQILERTTYPSWLAGIIDSRGTISKSSIDIHFNSHELITLIEVSHDMTEYINRCTDITDNIKRQIIEELIPWRGEGEGEGEGYILRLSHPTL